MSRRVLVVACQFPPTRVVGVLRPAALAHYLPDHGLDVHVLCEAESGRQIQSGFQLTAVGSTPPPASKRPKSRASNPIKRQIKRLLGRAVFPDKHVGFIAPAVRAASRIAQNHPVTLVYASGPMWSGLVAGWLISRRLGVPFIAEFQDPWAGSIYKDWSRFQSNAARVIERRIVSDARLVVTVTEAAAELMRRRYPTARVHSIPVGFDPELLKMRTKRDDLSAPIEIVHAGILYGGRRDPGPLFQAIQTLLADGNLRAGDLRVSFLGIDSEHAAQRATEFGVQDFVFAEAAVARPEALDRLSKAHATLTLIYLSTEERTAIPAKIYECLALGRALLCIGPSGHPAQAVLKDIPGAAFCSQASEVVDWLTALMASSQPGYPIGISAIEQFRWDRTIAQVADLLREI